MFWFNDLILFMDASLWQDAGTVYFQNFYRETILDYHLLLIVAGRLLMGGIFICAGVIHFLAFQPPLAIIRGRGVPNPAAVLVIGSIWEIVLGLLVVFGIGLLPASLGLVLFLIPATIIFHNFWDHQGLARIQHLHVVMTNIMVAGGLMILAASAL